jgi:hypothetical protein
MMRYLCGVSNEESIEAGLDGDPPMTPAGQAKFNATRFFYSPRLAARFGERPDGQMRSGRYATAPVLRRHHANGNSSVRRQSGAVSEWQHVYRPIWTDGRELPKDALDNPRWLGYSVGKRDLTLNDPKIYTKPWVSDTKTFKLQPMKEMQEIFCVRIRDPAGGVATKK